jgi:GMP synthase-like glutamine amidotransferase
MRSTPEPLPGLASDRYCVFEPITPRIRAMRVVIVNCLIQAESDYSEIARQQAGFDAGRWAKLERRIAALALPNIENNVRKLVRQPEIRVVHLSEVNDGSIAAFDPDAIVLSGTLRDFDFYDQRLIENFNQFIHKTRTPVLAICGGHQLVGQAFGATITTIDGKPLSQKRSGRLIEYQYRFVKITEINDPIFTGIEERPHLQLTPRWQKYTERRHLLRVWQNHGLELDRLPEGFRQLARGYLSEYQMIARRTAEQLIYGVQFHLEKSFQDWQTDGYWEHRNESRDGRLLFDNFLVEALRFRGKAANLASGNSGPLPAADAAKAASAQTGAGFPATGF